MNRARPRRESERGTALIVVLIVVVGVIGMLGVLFPMSQRNIASERSSRISTDLQLLLRTAIADAFDEIKSESDASNDGVGVLGCELVQAQGSDFNISDALKTQLGIPLATGTGGVDDLSTLGLSLDVRVDGTTVRSLGRYLAVIESTDSTRTLHIAVASPNFERPEQMIGAQVQFSVPEGGNRAVVSMSGALGVPSSSDFDIGAVVSADVTIEDSSGTVPAWIISDGTLHASGTVTTFIGKMDKMAGLGGYQTSPPTPGEDRDTLSDTAEPLIQLNRSQIDGVAADLEQWISDLGSPDGYWIEDDDWADAFENNKNFSGTYDPADASATTLWEMGSSSESNDNFKLRNSLKADTNGGNAAVLLIDDYNRMRVEEDAELKWDGDVIWVCKGDYNLHVKDGKVDIKGNLFILVPDSVSNKTATLWLEGNSDKEPSLKVEGNLVMIGADDNNVRIVLDGEGKDKAPKIEVKGLMVLMGNRVGFFAAGKGDDDSSEEADVKVEGGIHLVTPTDGSSGLWNWHFKRAVKAEIKYDQGRYDSSWDSLIQRFPSLISWENKGWLETSPRDELNYIMTQLLTHGAASSNYSH